MDYFNDFGELIDGCTDSGVRNAIDRADKEVRKLLRSRERLLRRKPFTRGASFVKGSKMLKSSFGGTVPAMLSSVRRNVVSQDVYESELNPYMHRVLFDKNIPSICVRTEGNGYMEVEDFRTAIPMQQSIVDKQTLHVACMPMKFTLASKKPTDKMQDDFVMFKEYWDLRNQDGMKVKFVRSAKSYGEAGLLYYIDREGCVKSRLLSYDEGYVICSHNDANGDRIAEVVYYDTEDGIVIDCWDKDNCYRFQTNDDGEWEISVEPHGFGEIPLITKRMPVAWENAQSLIESYEILYNIFVVLQKKWGWGILYVKGNLDSNGRKIAGNIVLQDSSIEGKGDAKFLDPPSPQKMIETLDTIFQRIQIASATTFILPADIHTSSDTSGVAVQMTQSLDVQTAKNGIVDLQNVADKMTRLFKRGLAMELVNKGIVPDAVTEFDKLHINAHFDIWKPFSENEYNIMLATMKGSGLLSQRTAVEHNTISRPDELERIKKETEEAMAIVADSVSLDETESQQIGFKHYSDNQQREEVEE